MSKQVKVLGHLRKGDLVIFSQEEGLQASLLLTSNPYENPDTDEKFMLTLADVHVTMPEDSATPMVSITTSWTADRRIGASCFWPITIHNDVSLVQIPGFVTVVRAGECIFNSYVYSPLYSPLSWTTDSFKKFSLLKESYFNQEFLNFDIDRKQLLTDIFDQQLINLSLNKDVG